MYKELVSVNEYRFTVGEYFDEAELVESIELMQGDDGLSYIVKMKSGKEYYIPKSSVLWAVYD